jgi:hypothetical protein
MTFPALSSSRSLATPSSISKTQPLGGTAGFASASPAVICPAITNA